MRTLSICLLLLLTGILAACATPVSVLSPATPPATGPKKIRVAVASTTTVRYIPSEMAYELLATQGYMIEKIVLARFDLVPEAIIRGNADFGAVSPQGSWSAAAKGAPLVSIAAQSGPTWSIVANARVRDCTDLVKYPAAFSTTTGLNQSILTDWAKKTCNVVPQFLVVGDSKSRLMALSAGQIDVASLEIEDHLELEDAMPGKFHVVLNSALQAPDVVIATFAVARPWAAKNPEIVKDFIRAILTVHRRILDNPQLLRDEIAKRMGVDAARSQELADAYLTANVWDVNGGINPRNLQLTLDFLKETSGLPADLKTSDVADLSYLNAVLDEIGRK